MQNLDKTGSKEGFTHDMVKNMVEKKDGTSRKLSEIIKYIIKTGEGQHPA